MKKLIITYVIGAGLLVLPFIQSVGHSDFVYAASQVEHVDSFKIVNGDGETADVYFNGQKVYIDESINAAEMFYVREEIQLRVIDGNYGIIAGDNGDF